ncbi:S24 family peptidase [Allobaculum stercoricanis]|uniref:LexA family protein n=1 Tax=Allobaculum stercoricanis TaxID=174709 RepID=UPI002941FF6E|nr:S24 family peptidase [Allobaculum stercoricanis]
MVEDKMINQEIGDRVKKRRQELGLSQDELAKRLGYQYRSAVSKLEKGGTVFKQSLLKKVADALNTTPSTLMGYESNEEQELSSHSELFVKNLVPFEMKQIPLLGKIACGEPIFANEEHDAYVSVHGVHADFALEAQGDSMIGDRIHNSDIVFCRNQPTVNNGEIAVVIIDDEATLKHFYYYPDRAMVILKASNPAYEDLIYMDDEIEKIRILGKAVAVEFGI